MTFRQTLAKKKAKPVLIDFTGWALSTVAEWKKKYGRTQKVDSLMRSKFVVVSLYVDERTKLCR